MDRKILPKNDSIKEIVKSFVILLEEYINLDIFWNIRIEEYISRE
jgi:hypothetical protein